MVGSTALAPMEVDRNYDVERRVEEGHQRQPARNTVRVKGQHRKHKGQPEQPAADDRESPGGGGKVWINEPDRRDRQEREREDEQSVEPGTGRRQIGGQEPEVNRQNVPVAREAPEEAAGLVLGVEIGKAQEAGDQGWGDPKPAPLRGPWYPADPPDQEEGDEGESDVVHDVVDGPAVDGGG